MVSQQIIEIIIRAEDKASQQAKQVNDQLDKLGNAGKSAMDKTSKASDAYKNKLQKVYDKLDKTVENVNKVGNEGAQSFKKLSKSQQDAVTKFNMLDKKTQTTLQAIREMGSTDMFPDAKKALSSFSQMDNLTRSWSGSLDYAKSKMQLLGNNTNTLKGKIQTTGMAIQTYLGTKWDVIKNKVSVVAQEIKGKLGGAIDTVKGKLSGLSNGFSKLGSSAKATGGNFGFLNNILSMTIGMIGYDLFNSFMQYGRAAINAEGQLQYFGERLHMSTAETEEFSKSLEKLQTQFRKVDMKAVGASAEEMAVKFNLSKDSLVDLTEVTAVMSSAFVKEGRTQEDAMLAVNDAMDGQFKRLQELGITQEMLMKNGWSGDIEDKTTLLQAMKKSLDDMGFTETAKDITSLDEAFQALGIAGGQLLASILIPITPILIQIAEGAMAAFDVLKEFIGAIQELFGGSKESSAEMEVLSQKTDQFKGAMSQVNGTVTPILGTLNDLGSALGGVSSNVSWLKESFNGLPEWAQLALGVGALATALGLLGSILWVTVIPSLYGTATAIWAAFSPILPFIAAAAGLAVVIYEIGKAFGWWSDIATMLDAIRAGAERMWQAFINNQDVKEIITALGEAWNYVAANLEPAIQAVLEFFGVSDASNFDIVGAAIKLLGDDFHALVTYIKLAIGFFQGVWDVLGQVAGKIGEFIGFLQKTWEGFNKVMNALGPFADALLMMSGPVGMVVEILRQVVCILLGCSPGIVPALEKVAEVFTTVWEYIVGFIGGIIANVVSAIQPVLDILTNIANFIIGAFQYAWQTLVMIFTIVMTHINNIIMIFSEFLSGQISLEAALSMIWEQIKTMWLTVLTTLTSRIGSFAINVINKALEIGRGFLNGIINYISSLPGQVYSYLISVVTSIIFAGMSWFMNGVSVAQNLVNAVVDKVKELPGKVYDEFINIGTKMLDAGGKLVQDAMDIGKNIVDGLLGAMGIHSPGIIQTKVVGEFEGMVGGVADYIKPAMETAKELGEGVVDAFGEPSLSIDTTDFLNEDAMKTAIGVQADLINDLDAPSMDLGVGVDTSGLGDVAESNDAVIGSYNNLANMTGNSLQKMVNQDKLAYTNIRNNDANQLSSIKNNLSNNMNNMTSKVNSSLNTMINKNKTGLNSARATTQTQLTNITNQTTKANQQMVKSWNTMKNGIVSAADKIKKDSTTHFNKLSGTIGSFYGKLKNPSRWGAGPGNGKVSNVKRIGSSNGGVKRIAQAVNALRTPQYLTVGQVQRNPLIDSKNFGDYIIPNKNNKYDLSQIIKYGALTIPIGLGAGSWSDTAPAHVSKIKNTSRNWDIKSPNIGRYTTSSAAFKVKEFESGTPKIGFSTFKKLAEEVFAKTHYDFYYDNDKHGNWLNAFNLGLMNCYHGAQAIIAMANAMGLSGSLVHGHWNQFGHFWANIAGHKMDVTGWQQQRNWTPAASHAGPAPRRTPTFGDLVDEINKEPEVVVEQNNSANGVIVDGEFTVNHKHEFINLPDTVSAEDVAKLINNSAEDESWIKKLVQNVRFQKWDLKEKAKIERRNNRAIGV